MSGAGLAFSTAPVDIREVPHAGEAPGDFARRMAFEKAEAGLAAAAPGASVLAADTVVTLDGAILGKPGDPDEACRMLARLAGRTHTVISALALHGPGGLQHARAASTQVRFLPLTAEQIAAYVATGEPLDKAGAYGIQGLGGRFVDAVEGDLSTVIGLPIGPTLAAVDAGGFLPAESAVARAARHVRARIAAAADGDGRPASAVQLVAVSKRQPDAAVGDALAAGLVDLGENYVQDLVARAAFFDASGGVAPRWHFIGHLQRNKCKQLLGISGGVACVHGLDERRTAEALGRVALDLGREQAVLVQVHLGDEDTKAGVLPAQLPEVLAGIGSVPGLRVEGLMAVPPPAAYGAARRHFAALRALRDACATPSRPLATLSMGMSGDYEAAISEGATCVRVGSALFGERAPKA